MGIFPVEIQVGDLDGVRYETLTALVNTGVSHLVVPKTVLEALGVQQKKACPSSWPTIVCWKWTSARCGLE